MFILSEIKNCDFVSIICTSTTTFKEFFLFFYLQEKNLMYKKQVEKPAFYLLARCPSNDKQILYSDTRLEDVKKLKYPTFTDSGISIMDCMRFFKGI